MVWIFRVIFLIDITSSKYEQLSAFTEVDWCKYHPPQDLIKEFVTSQEIII